MTRIAKRFQTLDQANKVALIPYVTAGDPRPEVTVPLMHAMVEAGASLIELGVPFSDPMADGPVIQRASERALEHATSLRDVLAMVRLFREQDRETPVILMGYLNFIFSETFLTVMLSVGYTYLLTTINRFNIVLWDESVTEKFLLNKLPKDNTSRRHLNCLENFLIHYFILFTFSSNKILYFLLKTTDIKILIMDE